METTFVWAILSGVVVFVVGQGVLKLVIEPIQQLARTIGETKHVLLYYNDTITELSTDVKIEARLRFRDLAARLLADSEVIPCYWASRWILKLPSRIALFDMHSGMIAISNNIGIQGEAGANINRGNAIMDAMGYPWSPFFNSASVISNNRRMGK